MTNKHSEPRSLRERILNAETENDLKYLEVESLAYAHASNRTQKRIKKAFKQRREEIC